MPNAMCSGENPCCELGPEGSGMKFPSSSFLIIALLSLSTAMSLMLCAVCQTRDTYVSEMYFLVDFIPTFL
jgi:hypothetical protein